MFHRRESECGIGVVRPADESLSGEPILSLFVAKEVEMLHAPKRIRRSASLLALML